MGKKRVQMKVDKMVMKKASRKAYKMVQQRAVSMDNLKDVMMEVGMVYWMVDMTVLWTDVKKVAR